MTDYRTVSAYANTTIASTSSTSSSYSYDPYSTPSGTCCYIVVDQVGVNTWYTNTAAVTVATAVTYWLQVILMDWKCLLPRLTSCKYNNTLIPANSTSLVTVPGATDAFGVYAQGGDAHPYTTVFDSVWTHTETYGGSTTTATVTFSNVSYTTPVPISGVPTTLLNQSDIWYQAQWVGSETAFTFTDQSLTV
jgi:hypothetical protein